MKKIIIFMIISLMLVGTINAIDYTADICVDGTAACIGTGWGTCDQVFDNVGGDPVEYGWAYTRVSTSWVQYSWATAKTIEKVRIWSWYTRGIEVIKDFNILGSNDGSSWTTLYTGQHPNEVTNAFVDYTFSNSNSYKFYRIEILSNWAGNGGNNVGISEVEMMEIVQSEPVYTEFTDPETTDLANVADIAAVDDPVLANDYAKVEWAGTYDFTELNLDNAIAFSNNFVSVDSSALPVLNDTANITLKGVTYTSLSQCKILKDGVECNEPECIKISADPVKFEVSGFSNYTTQNADIVSGTLDFDNASEWIEEDAADGTDIAGGTAELHTAGSVGPGTAVLAYTELCSVSNNQMTSTDRGGVAASSKFVTSGKWYFEGRMDSGVYTYTDTGISYDIPSKIYLSGNWYPQSRSIAAARFTGVGKIIGVAVDVDAGTVNFYENNVFVKTSSFTPGTTVYAYVADGSMADPISRVTARFLDTDMTYDPPAGYYKGFAPTSSAVTTTPHYITTSDDNNIDLDGATAVSSVAITDTQPTNTDIKVLVSFDGRATWKAWDGDSFETFANGLSNFSGANTVSEIENAFDDYTMVGSALDFAFRLETTDSEVSPSISGINVIYRNLNAPTYSEFSSDGDTTDLLVVDFSAVSDPILANDYAKVEWRATGLDLSDMDLDSAIQFNRNFVRVDSAAISALNTVANITLKGTYYTSVDTYQIFKDGSACGDCIKYSANPVKFEVSGFSNYTTEGNGSAVPEFSSITLGIGLLTILVGLVLIRRK